MLPLVLFILIAYTSLQWANAITIHTPPVEDLPQAFHMGSINFKCISMLDTSSCNVHTLCGRLNIIVAQRGCELQMESLNMSVPF